MPSPNAAIPTLISPPKRGASRLLADAFGRRIADGLLRPGDRLPTRRDIARHTGLGYGTISRTMTLLESRGLIEQKPGAGTFVTTATDVSVGVRRVGVVPPFWTTQPSSTIALDHLSGLNRAACALGHRVELVPNLDADAADHDFVARVMALKFDGLVWCAPLLEHETNLARLLDRKLPLVTTIRRFHRTPVPVVREDLSVMAMLLRRDLRRRGRKQLTIICRDEASDAHSADIIAALRAAKVNVDVWPLVGAPDAATQLADRLKKDRAPTAVLCLQLSLLDPLLSRRKIVLYQLWGSAASVRAAWPGRAINVIETPVAAIGAQALRALSEQWDLPPGDGEDLKPRLVALPGS